jgi:NAD(P)-dependent dehydrogenase (short-subunit alcohol dehydrogenase family)
MRHLEDQVVLITGCSTGIGRALAGEFARRGHRVFASARRPETLEDLSVAGKLRLDVTDEASAERAVAGVLAAAGRIDMLINNAGFNVFGPLAELPLDGVRRLFETNVTGLLTLVQKVFPSMAERGSGRIVNIGSVVGIVPTPFAGAYCSTKAAVHMLSDVLRMELAPFGIDVVVVQPGGVRSSIAETGAQGLERYAEDSSRYQPVHRQIVKRANASQVEPMDTDAFAAVVVEAVTRRRAPRIVRAGRGSAILPSLGRLPGSALDRVMTRQFQLDRLRRDGA